MKRLLFAFSLIIFRLTVAAAQQPQQGSPPSVNPFNVPDELRACVRAKANVKINGGVNPFYLSGDFDGDGLTDFAVQVKSKERDAKGILFCFANGKIMLLGAGSRVAWPQDNPTEWPFDSWMLIRKGSKHLSIYPQMKFDTVALVKSDEGGGLLYWDGHRFKWKSEE